MGYESYELGIKGEDAAEIYLKQHGFEIIERNFHSQQGEIDIIARDKDFLVFVEIKNYSFRSYGPPAGAVRKSKRQSIIYTARYYLYKNRVKNTNCRFDVLTIYKNSSGARAIEHYRNAFAIN
ncbi:MAG: YraN family protein [Candidatus Margulisbacteria bacterium]|nr:YraN family protein [Candidatus Margulisiibacteriota bacterium]